MKRRSTLQYAFVQANREQDTLLLYYIMNSWYYLYYQDNQDNPHYY